MDDLILANHKFRKSHASRKRRRRKLARWHDFKVGLAGANWRAAFQADLVAVVVAERGLNTDFHIPLIRHFDGSLRFLGSARHRHRKGPLIMKRWPIGDGRALASYDASRTSNSILTSSLARMPAFPGGSIPKSVCFTVAS